MKIESEGGLRFGSVILFIIFSFVIFWPIFLGKVNLNGHLLVSFYNFYGENLPYKDAGWDQLRIYFPFYKTTLDAFRSFSLPFWNPYAFSGHTHLADFQTAIFYPLNIFGLILPQIEFWHLLRLSAHILAAFFTFLYLRNSKLSKISSFFGAFVFGFSPFLVTWGEEVVMSVHSIVFLPAILYSIDRISQRLDRKDFLLLVFGVVFSLFAGYLQTTIYVFAFVTFYILYKFVNKEINLSRAVYVYVGIVAGILVSSIQLLPSAELYFNSARSGVDHTSVIRGFLLPLEAIITYLAPDFFGNPATHNHFLLGSSLYYESMLFVGVIPLIFAVVAVVNRSKLSIFLALVGIFSLLTVFDSAFSRLFIKLPIPFVSTAIPNRILFLPAFCIAILAARGMDLWLLKKEKNLYKVLTLFGAFFAVLLVPLGLKVVLKIETPVDVWQVFREPVISFRNLAIPAGIFGVAFLALVFIKNRKAVALLLVVLTLFQLWYFAQKYLSFSERKYVFPKNEVLDFIAKNQEFNRTEFVGEHLFASNFATQYEIFSPEGYDSLNNRFYSNFVFKMQGSDNALIALRRSDAELGLRDNLKANLANSDRRKLLNILGVRFLVAGGDDVQKLDDLGLKRVFDGKGVVVFENEDALSRVKMFYKSETGVGEEALDRVLSEDFNIDETVLVDKDMGQLNASEGSVNIVSYEPERVLVETNLSGKGILVLFDNYFYGWKVKIDGAERSIYKADSTFKAAVVDAGVHSVEFYYDNLAFKLGSLISAVTLIILFFFTWKFELFSKFLFATIHVPGRVAQLVRAWHS